MTGNRHYSCECTALFRIFEAVNKIKLVRQLSIISSFLAFKRRTIRADFHSLVNLPTDKDMFKILVNGPACYNIGGIFHEPGCQTRGKFA